MKTKKDLIKQEIREHNPIRRGNNLDIIKIFNLKQALVDTIVNCLNSVLSVKFVMPDLQINW